MIAYVCGRVSSCVGLQKVGEFTCVCVCVCVCLLVEAGTVGVDAELVSDDPPWSGLLLQSSYSDSQHPGPNQMRKHQGEPVVL